MVGAGPSAREMDVRSWAKKSCPRRSRVVARVIVGLMHHWRCSWDALRRNFSSPLMPYSTHDLPRYTPLVLVEHSSNCSVIHTGLGALFVPVDVHGVKANVLWEVAQPDPSQQDRHAMTRERARDDDDSEVATGGQSRQCWPYCDAPAQNRAGFRSRVRKWRQRDHPIGHPPRFSKIAREFTVVPFVSTIVRLGHALLVFLSHHLLQVHTRELACCDNDVRPGGVATFAMLHVVGQGILTGERP
jgi:hypothetical protein